MEAQQETKKSCCGGAAASAPVAPPAVGGPFELIDHHGASVSQASWPGRHRLMFFGFSHCQVVCPRALQRFNAMLALLTPAERQALALLYISVDPERDTPAVLRDYLAAQAPAVTGLTGSRGQVDAVLKTFRVFARRSEDADAPGGYVVPHTAITYLCDPDGNYLAHFSDAIDAAELARRLRPWLAPAAAAAS